MRILSTTVVISGFTLLSRALGFLRDLLIAHLFGASADSDAFVIAFKIPNFLRRLFAEGCFSQVFIPMLTSYQDQHKHAATLAFIAHVQGALISILLPLTWLGIFFSDFFIQTLAPGFLAVHPERFVLASQLLKITFPYLLLIALTAMSASVLNVYNHFAVPAFTPSLLNLSMIFTSLTLYAYFDPPIVSLAWGVCLAGVLQWLFQTCFLMKHKLSTWPKFGIRDPDVRKLLWLMIPGLFSVSIAQISTLLETLFASYLPTGTVSWLYFANQLSNLPSGVFSTAIATVILPVLARQWAKNQEAAYQNTVDWALQWTLLIALPATVGLVVLSEPIIVTLFLNGPMFKAQDAWMTSQCLFGFALGLPAFMVVKVLSSGFYAKKKLKTPVIVAAIALLANVVANLCLVGPLQHLGLALASSIAAYVNLILLLFFIIRQGLYRMNLIWLTFLIKLLTANTAMLLMLMLLKKPIAAWISLTGIQRWGHLILSIVLSAAIYTLSVMGLFRHDPLRIRLATL